MPRKERITFVVLVSVAIALWAGLAWGFYQDNWFSPLGLSLALPSHTVAPKELTPGLELPENPIFNITSDPPATHLPSVSPSPFLDARPALCNGPKSMSILAIGSDTRAQNYLYGLADVIRYIHIDFLTPRINVLEFPRDLWVEVPDIENHYQIDHGKLNQAYFYGNPGMGYYQGPGQGPGLLARTLDLNFGARPDNYIAINMQTFVRVIDTIGGLDIYLPYSVDGRKADQPNRKDLYFPAGPHHLNGEQALMLGRIREYSVFGRADQQNRLLCALREAVMTPYILPKLPAIIDDFSRSIQTDLSPDQISQLACLIPHLKPGEITFTTFPNELLSESRIYDIGVQKDVFIYKADFKILRTYVQAFDLGIWPDPNSTEVMPESPQNRGKIPFKCP